MTIKVKRYKWDRFNILKIENDQVAIFVNDDIVKVVKSLNLKDKNVIDGGSNIGVHSLLFSRCVGKKGKVYAFELQTVICQIGMENAKLNNKENIIHHNKALSDKSGQTVGFTEIDYVGEHISSGGVRTEVSLCGQIHCGRIETIAIDDMNIENVGLIKLDLEGNEPKALDGMWQTIDKNKPCLIIELSPGYLLEGKDKETIDKIISHGYKVTELGGFNYFFEPI